MRRDEVGRDEPQRRGDDDERAIVRGEDGEKLVDCEGQRRHYDGLRTVVDSSAGHVAEEAGGPQSESAALVARFERQCRPTGPATCATCGRTPLAETGVGTALVSVPNFVTLVLRSVVADPMPLSLPWSTQGPRTTEEGAEEGDDSPMRG